MVPQQSPSDDEEGRGVPAETSRFDTSTHQPSKDDADLRDSHQIIETARNDPTAPLHVGTDVDTGAPVTITADNRYAPLLITASTGRGKTTLCHHLANQQLGPDSGLCYLSRSPQPFESCRPTDREENVIVADLNQKPTDVVPDTLGRDATSHSVLFGPAMSSVERTTLTSTLIEQVITNRHRQIGLDVSRYTLVLDGIDACVEWDRINLRQLLVEAHKQRFSVVIATQMLACFPLEVRQQLEDYIQTYLTSSVPPTDANHFANIYPMATADDFHTIPRFRWWLYEQTREGTQETQFTSLPRSSDQERTLDKDREVM